MAGFIDRLKDMIFDVDPVDENMMDENMMEMDEVQVEIEEDYLNQDANYSSRNQEKQQFNNSKSSKVVNMEKPNLTAVNGGGSIKMVLFQPLNYEDSQAIIDNLRANKPVIVNMVDLERETAQRVLDFMAGAVYALDGTIRRVSYGIFVIVPSSITIVGHDEEESASFRS